MTQSKATTMQLPVKLVREIATLSIEEQRRALKRSALKTVDYLNQVRAANNRSLFHRLLKLLRPRPDQVMLDPEATYEEWKKLWLTNKMDMNHVAYCVFARAKTAWWKRLRQFSEMPTVDDDRMMSMSMEDLDLIDYTFFINKQQSAEEVAAS